VRIQKITLIFLILIIPLAIAQTQDQAQQCMEESELTIAQMNKSGFGTLRVSDTYKEMVEIYTAQLVIQESGVDPNYHLITSRCEDIDNVYHQAVIVHDEISAVQLRLDELSDMGMENDTLDAQYNEILIEFQNERYETVEELIENLYEDMSEAQANITKVKALYETGRASFTRFLTNNWKELIIFFIIAFILGLISQNQLRIYLLKRNRQYLIVERDILKDLIKKAQKKYFEHKELSEGEYSIKVNKFKELIRDVNRKIPIVDEELSKRKNKFIGSLIFKKQIIDSAVSARLDAKLESKMKGKNIDKSEHKFKFPKFKFHKLAMPQIPEVKIKFNKPKFKTPKFLALFRLKKKKLKKRKDKFVIKRKKIKKKKFKFPKISLSKFKLPRFHAKKKSKKKSKFLKLKLPKLKLPKFKPKTSRTSRKFAWLTVSKKPKKKTIKKSQKKFKFPKISLPKIVLPKLPKIKLPKLKKKKHKRIQKKKSKIPKPKKKFSFPKIKLPKFKLPKIQAPKLPEVHMPEVHAPTLPHINPPKLPEVHMPKLPHVEVPEPPKLEKIKSKLQKRIKHFKLKLKKLKKFK